MTPRPIPAELSKPHLTDKMAFREGWRWVPDVRRWFLRETSDLVSPPPRPVIHVCSGSSTLGEIRVDRWHPSANVRADMLHLPLADGAAGTVICDPPWDMEFRRRIALHREIARVLRVDGLLLWSAPWIPNEGHFTIDRLYIVYQRVGLPRDARLLVRAHRRAYAGKTRPQRKAAEKVPPARREAPLEVAC